MVTASNHDILVAVGVLSEFGNGKVPLPDTLKLRVARLIRELGSFQKDYEKSRQMLVLELSKRNDDGEVVTRPVTREDGSVFDQPVLLDPIGAEARANALLHDATVSVPVEPLALREMWNSKTRSYYGTAEQLAALGPFLLLDPASEES